MLHGAGPELPRAGRVRGGLYRPGGTVGCPPHLLSSPYPHVTVFLGLVVGGARLSDILIHYTIPDNPCRGPLMALTVSYLGAVLLLSLAYLGVLVMAVVNHGCRRCTRRLSRRQDGP